MDDNFHAPVLRFTGANGVVLTAAGGRQLLGGDPLVNQVARNRQGPFAGEFPVVLPFAFTDRIGIGMPDDADFFAGVLLFDRAGDAVQFGFSGRFQSRLARIE